jgi:type IV conjugative transfer system protein TraL
MDDKSLFQNLNHLNEPRRLYGLQLDDAVIGGITIFLTMIFSAKLLILAFGFAVRMAIKHVKKNNPPSYLGVLAYWYLPRFITKIYTKGMPPSHIRYWVN